MNISESEDNQTYTITTTRQTGAELKIKGLTKHISGSGKVSYRKGMGIIKQVYNISDMNDPVNYRVVRSTPKQRTPTLVGIGFLITTP